MSFIVLLLLQDCFLTMGPAWYQSLIKVLLNRFPQSCRHFDDSRTQYLVRRTNVRLTNEAAVGFSAVKGKTVCDCVPGCSEPEVHRLFRVGLPGHPSRKDGQLAFIPWPDCMLLLKCLFISCIFFFLDQSLKVVFREPLPLQPQAGSSPPPQLVSMYHHLESVINTACYNLWTGLLWPRSVLHVPRDHTEMWRHEDENMFGERFSGVSHLRPLLLLWWSSSRTVCWWHSTLHYNMKGFYTESKTKKSFNLRCF